MSNTGGTLGKATDNREQLVRTAMRLFRRNGYANVGLQEILAESGAPRGSLYYYFPEGKEALGEAAVRMAGRMIAEMLEDLARRRRTSRGFIRGYCRQMAEWMEESGFSSGCPIATTVLETVPDSPRIQRAGREAVDSWTGIISAVFVREGMARAPARQRAQSLVAAMEGALIIARLHGSGRPITQLAATFEHAFPPPASTR